MAAMRNGVVAALVVAAAFCTCGVRADGKVFGRPVHVGKAAGERGMAVAKEGNMLFAGVGPRLYAFDVSSPMKPVLLGSLGGFDNLRQIRVRGRFVYVVSRETGMRIVDASDPARMRIRSRYDSVEFATGIEVAGDVAFLSERIYGVEAVDVSDPDRPAHIALRKTPESQSCRYRDGYLYSGEWGAGLVSVFDARDMRRFGKVAELPLGGFGDGVEIDGRYLYCSTGHDSRHRGVDGDMAQGAGRGLDIFDISDAAKPRHVSRIDFPVFKPRNADFWTPRVADGFAFCCDSHNGLFAVDVRDPAHPKLADRLCIPMTKKDKGFPSAAFSSLEVGEGCLYATCAPGGLYVIPVAGVHTPCRPIGTPPANPSHRECYDTDASQFHVYRPAASGQARTVVLRGDIAYVAFGDAGLHVLRIKDEGGFEKIGELPGCHRVTDCCFSGDRLLAAEGLDGFALYEVDGAAGFREIARRGTAHGAVGSVAFWCWAPDAKHVVLSRRTGPYEFFSADGFADSPPLASLHGSCQWHRYPAASALGTNYPILKPSRGIIWVELGDAGVRVLSNPKEKIEKKTVAQTDGVTPFGDRYFCTASGGYMLIAPDRTASKWRPLGKGGHSGVPSSDGRNVVISARSLRLVSVWDFSDVEKPRLLRKHVLSGNPDIAALYRGKAIIPAGHQGLLMER